MKPRKPGKQVTGIQELKPLKMPFDSDQVTVSFEMGYEAPALARIKRGRLTHWFMIREYDDDMWICGDEIKREVLG